MSNRLGAWARRHPKTAIACAIVAIPAVVGVVQGATGTGHTTPAANTAPATTQPATAPSPAAPSTGNPAPAPSSPVPHTSSKPPAGSAPAAAPEPSCSLPNGRDVIVRYQVPGMADAAQELGEVDLANCTDTVDSLAATADMEPGACTWVAWADQNPGYDVNADVAPPLKHVLFAVGPAC